MHCSVKREPLNRLEFEVVDRSAFEIKFSTALLVAMDRLQIRVEVSAENDRMK